MIAVRRGARSGSVRAPRVALCGALLALCACQPSAPPAPTRPALPAPAQMLAQVRAIGASAPDSLEVQPLSDPAVTDLRQRALRLERQADYTDAAKAIAQALTLQPGDPELLQQAAEYALFQHDWPRAGALARQSFERGPRVGSLCRRNWETLRFVAMAHADAIATQAAVVALAACTVEPPPRY